MNQRWSGVALCAFCLICLIQATHSTYNEVQVGRYSSVRPVPTESQKDVFLTILTVEFPNSIRTVGEAMNEVLSDQGLQLAPTISLSPELGVLLDLPLPKEHRKMGPMSLKSVLETLAGPVWRLVQDPVHRMVAFELCKKDADKARVDTDAEENKQ